MSKAEITSSIKTFGSYAFKKSGYYGSTKNKPKKNKAGKLHSGEIVLGLILERPAENIAVIRLPAGIFTAELHNRLKRGDKMFFKVMQTSPNIILTPHSVYSFKNKQSLNINEILRLFDLPDSKHINEIINTIRKNKSIITRDNILIMNKYSSLLDNDEEYKKFFNTIFWLNEANIKITKDTLAKFQPIFVELIEINNKFKKLVELEKENKIFKKVFSKIKSKNVRFSDLLKFWENLSTEIKNNELLLADTNYKRELDFFSYYEKILDTYNHAALQNQSLAHIIFPFPYENELTFCRIIIQLVTETQFNSPEHKTSIINYLLTQGNFDFTISNIPLIDNDIFSSIAEQLSKSFNKPNIAIFSFVILKSQTELDLLSIKPHLFQKNFSLVI